MYIYEPQSLHPEDESNTVLRNVSILHHHYVASQPRRPRLRADMLCIMLSQISAK
jgi:hypothetical protein